MLTQGQHHRLALETSISSGAFKILSLLFSPESSGFFAFFSFQFVTAFTRKSAAVIPVTAVANIQPYCSIQSNLRRVKSIAEPLPVCSALSRVLATPDFTGQILCSAFLCNSIRSLGKLLHNRSGPISKTKENCLSLNSYA